MWKNVIEYRRGGETNKKSQSSFAHNNFQKQTKSEENFYLNGFIFDIFCLFFKLEDTRFKIDQNCFFVRYDYIYIYVWIPKEIERERRGSTAHAAAHFNTIFVKMKGCVDF